MKLSSLQKGLSSFILLVLLSVACKVQQSASEPIKDKIITYFVEDQPAILPIEKVKIRINLVLLQNDEGLGGFDKDNPEHLDLLQSAVIWMNGSFAGNPMIKDANCYNNKNCFPQRSAENYKYIADAGIEFVIGEILTFKESKYWDNKDCQDGEDDPEKKNCPEDGLRYRCPDDEYSGKWYLNPLSQEINSNPNILPAINIFFTEDGAEYQSYVVEGSCENPVGRFHTQDCSERPSNALDKALRVHMRSTFLKYNYLMNCNVCETSGADCQNVGTPQECCKREMILNNLKDGMSRTLMHELGHTLEFTAGHCNVCPKEALMHATKPGKTMHSAEIEYAHQKIKTSNLRKYVVSNQPIIINQEKQVWSNFFNLHNHYVVYGRSTLELKNQTIVLPGNQLVVDSSTLVIHEQAQLILSERSKLVIKAGSNLNIKNGGLLLLSDKSQLIIECGARVEIEEKATLVNRGKKGEIISPCNHFEGIEFNQ
jgi:hypothetical protein